jgi:hypothetical protein
LAGLFVLLHSPGTFHVVTFGAMRLTLTDSVRCNILSQLRLNVAAMAVVP